MAREIAVSPATVAVRFLSGTNALREEAPGIEEMLSRMAYPSFFCAPTWLLAVAQSPSCANNVLLLKISAGDDAIGYLPLARRPNCLGGNDLVFLGSRFYPDPLGAICAAADRKRCACAVVESLAEIPSWDRLVLESFTADEAYLWPLKRGFSTVEPYLVLPDNFEELLKTFSKKRRYNMRTAVRKFSESGGRFVEATTDDERRAFLDALFRLHADRAAERQLASTFAGSTVYELHRFLTGSCEQVRLYALFINDEVISVLYGFVHAGRFFYYQIAHDPVHSQIAPGTVLLYLVIQRCCQTAIREFNFLQGGESYKALWTHSTRTLCSLTAYSATPRAAALRIADTGRRFAVRALRRRPAPPLIDVKGDG